MAELRITSTTTRGALTGGEVMCLNDVMLRTNGHHPHNEVFQIGIARPMGLEPTPAA